MAQAIASEIKAKVTPEERTRLVRRSRPVKPEAYELYLKGRYEWNKRTEEGMKKGLEYFQKAIDIEPTYALAYSGLADCYSLQGDDGFLPGPAVYPKAKVAASRALELDPDLAEAHVSLGLLLIHEWDWAGALREYETAIQLNPNYATAHHWYGDTLSFLGRNEAAVREIRLAQRLDPLSPRINADVAQVFYFGRQYAEAITEAVKALDLKPSNGKARAILVQSYLRTGKSNEALAELQRISSLKDTNLDVALPAQAYAAVGNREKALEIVDSLKKLSNRNYVPPLAMARAYVAVGQNEEALRWLHRELGFYHEGISVKVDPALDPLRSDPRFQDLLRRMNFPK